MVRLWRDLWQFFRTWWLSDRIRVSPAEGRLLRIKAGDLLVVGDLQVEVMKRICDETSAHNRSMTIDNETNSHDVANLAGIRSAKQNPAEALVDVLGSASASAGSRHPSTKSSTERRLRLICRTPSGIAEMHIHFADNGAPLSTIWQHGGICRVLSQADFQVWPRARMV